MWHVIWSRNGMTAQAKSELSMFCHMYKIGGNFFCALHLTLRYMAWDNNTQVWVTCGVDDGTPLEILTACAALEGKALFIFQLSNYYVHLMQQISEWSWVQSWAQLLSVWSSACSPPVHVGFLHVLQFPLLVTQVAKGESQCEATTTMLHYWDGCQGDGQFWVSAKAKKFNWTLGCISE